MTTAVYVRWSYLAADKRATGWPSGINDNVSKIFEFKWEAYHIYAVFAGIRMMPGLINSLIVKHLIDKVMDLDFQKWLYDFKEEIEEHAWDNFECILVDKNNWIGYMITKEAVIDIPHYVTIGSGSYYAEGILLRDPTIEPAMLFKLVSTKDVQTNEYFDLIDLTT